MPDKFNIIDEKTPEEEKAERLEKRLERIFDMERLDRLAKEEMADIDAMIGILFQTRGLLQMKRSASEDIEEFIDDMMTVATAMVNKMNKMASKKKKKVKKDGNQQD